jgi:hypothetical protein
MPPLRLRHRRRPAPLTRRLLRSRIVMVLALVQGRPDRRKSPWDKPMHTLSLAKRAPAGTAATEPPVTIERSEPAVSPSERKGLGDGGPV